ncbi:uncharacterized protein FOMMEDRAFT_154090 [Fomitiporia mediterranea MF3/22]|uniref:uncharacterized protein n=1 Tax=Fomitiporia mediterranea (strain MF3/22) TaxID=694068 RepID=UPI000440857D|nr:uncharacterized protein FOMMEDRAFT_154090 [Fomitiporia mediterranea MF3/22]EJD04942.1 hypothetical protein FOMMEDRAFT_154090 [Fomitiporia mediterranea MF3/22]
MSLINGQLRSRAGYVPDEVLSLIFLECLEVDYLDCATPSPLHAPLVLSWICRHWRNVALNTRQLWRGVCFTRQPDRINDNTSLLKLWIERSGALPFGVRLANLIGDGERLFSFEHRMEMDPAVIKGIEDFIGVLMTCSNRWRVVELTVPEVSHATPVLNALVKGVNALEHLCISSQYLGIHEHPVIYDFSSNNSLETVRLITPLIAPLPTGNRDTFKSLSMLELHFCASIHDCITWIDMAPNLEHLTLRVYGTGEGARPLQDQRIRRLPYLDSLEITYFAANSQFEQPGVLLDVLDVPKLTKLELNMNHLFDWSPFPNLRNLLVRSGASLESMIFSGTHMLEAEIIELLRLSPDLECFVDESVTDGVLAALTPSLLPEVADLAEARPMPTIEEVRESKMQTSDAPMELDAVPSSSIAPISQPSSTTNINSNPNTDSDSDSKSKFEDDPSNYTVLCPNLQYFESEDIDMCSLQPLYAFMSTRCEELYKDIQDYVDATAVRPVPDEFKTLISVVLPCDPMYGVLSHPKILESMERNIYF